MKIEIERMLFGDYRVQVWDARNISALDREYFCRGFGSALLTAQEIRTLPGFEKLDIYYRDSGESKLIDEFKKDEMQNM